MQCETLLKELEKWQGVSNLNHFTGVARKSLNTDFEEVYLVQDTQKSNLL
jgi:hypothetical protein